MNFSCNVVKLKEGGTVAVTAKNTKNTFKPPEPVYACYCTHCGKGYKKQKGNFLASHSPLYIKSGYLPVCKNCLNELLEYYTELLGDENYAIRRMCMKLDIYYSDELLKAARNVNKDYNILTSYISKSNLIQYNKKTYDTTIEEESVEVIDSVADIKQASVKVKEKSVKFFGVGFEAEDYKYLQDQYDDWTARHECKTKAHEELFKTICMAQLNILKAQKDESQGKTGKVSAAMKSLQELLNAAQLTPKQMNNNTLVEQNTFGTLIKKWENEKPISEPDPEWEDVDGIVKYITVYFLGHLCKMVGINNRYSRMYDEEMEKYKVNKPQYDDDANGEVLFDSIFGGGVNGD